MGLSVAYNMRLAGTETLTGPYISPTDPTVGMDQLSVSGTKDGASTPSATKQSSGQLVLTAGAGTIDFTALPGLTAEEVRNMTGLRLLFMLLRNKSTNANKVTVVRGASNGYGLDASGDTFTIPLSPGQQAMRYDNGLNIAVDATHKLWDVTGTGAQILEYHFVFGA